MRIRGLVKASHTVRDQLKIGIPINEIPQFKQYITDSIQATEQICANTNAHPNQLPLPSRKAYQFLKSVDLKNLPVSEQSSSIPSQKRISIRQIRRQHQHIQHQIAEVAQTAGFNSPKGRKLTQLLQQTAQEIEDLCDRQAATVANLTGQSRQIYCWLKFLLSDDNLQLHIKAIHHFDQLLQRTIAQQQNSPNAKIKQLKNSKTLTIEFANMSALYRCQLSSGPGSIKINEGFILAEPAVLQAMIDSMLWGKSPKTTSVFSAFSLSDEFSELLLAMELMADDLDESAHGNTHNLDKVFEEVNQTYFGNTLAKPKLCWGHAYSKRKFGHYDPTRDRIVISLNLDAQQVPPYVVEFVMYHELLHKVHGSRLQNGRRMAHTSEFRGDERKFKQFSQAEQHLSRLARTS